MKKALKVFALAVGYLVAYLFVLFVLLYFAEFIDSNFQLHYADPIAFVFGNVLMIGLLIYFRHRTRDKWIRAEAQKWLAKKSRHLIQREHPWHGKLRRTVLWIPSAVVLTIFLFLPEIAGLASHLICGRYIRLGQYRVETPLTWFAVSGSNPSAASFIAGKGIGRAGFRSYWRGEPPISEMIFYVGQPSNGEIWAHAKILSERTFRLGTETLACRDILENADRQLVPADFRYAVILCSTPQDDFHTDFLGPRSELPAFYDALKSVTLTQ